MPLDDHTQPARGLAIGCALALTLALAAARPVSAAELRVRVEGVRSGDGRVLVAVCSSEVFLTDRCPRSGAGPAQEGTTEVIVPDVAAGVYSVQAFHDENDNRDLDRSMIGFPLEGLGFSRDAPMRFGPPRFADAAIEISEPSGTLSFSLRYFHQPRVKLRDDS